MLTEPLLKSVAERTLGSFEYFSPGNTGKNTKGKGKLLGTEKFACSVYLHNLYSS